MHPSKINILVAHAFFLKNDAKQLKDKFKPYPPLATLYAASKLQRSGYNISLFDAVLADDFDDFDVAFKRADPALLIIYEDDFNFLTKMCLSHVREASLKMIERAKSMGVTVIVHSSDASDCPETYLSSGAKYIIYGEGEQSLSEIVDYCLKEGQSSISDIQGIYHFADGKIEKNNERKTLRRLDELPQPAWDLIDFDKYRDAWVNKHGFFSVNMVTTRGCPYKCNWCAKPIWGQQYHSHSPEYVAKQLEWLVKNAAIEHVWFSDDIFGLKKDWIESYAKKVTELDIKVPFMIQSRADLIDKKIAKALENAGCEEVWLGVESGSQAVLDSMDKEVELHQIRTARKLLGEVNIKVGFFIQLGYPGEDIVEIEQTRRMILDMMPEKIGVSVSYPLPGTKFYQNVKNQMVGKTHWLESNDLDTVFFATFTSQFYRQIRKHLHNELNAHHQKLATDEWESKWQLIIQSADEYRVENPTLIQNNDTQHCSKVSFDNERIDSSIGFTSSAAVPIKIQTL